MSLALTSPGPVNDERCLDLGGVAVHLAGERLEVEDDVGDVFLDTLDRGELVRDSLDAKAGDGGACERGQHHTAQRTAEGVAEATVQRFDRENTAVAFDLLGRNARSLEFKH